jgi:CubicO group peptidase (beta-lactamase class C family)
MHKPSWAGPSPDSLSIWTVRLAALALVLTSTFLGVALASPRSASRNVERVVSGYETERDFSGVVLVQQGSRRAFAAGVGPAERAFGARNALDTRFQIASISKLFVSVAVMRLVDEGKLSLDTPIGGYVAGLPSAMAAIPIFALMQHTAGLPRESDFQPWERLTTEEHVARIARAGIDANLVGRYNYSNSGYVLLTGLIEAASGQSYPDFLARQVLRPAGLNDTGFILGDNTVPRLATGYARGRTGWREPWRARHRGVYGPGGLYSTASDLNALISALQEGRILSPSSTEELFRPRTSTGEGQQMASYAGVITPRNGENYLLVAGSGDGAKATLMRALGSRLTVVLLANNGDVPITEMLRDVVIAAEGGGARTPSACRLANPAAFGDFVGEYDFTRTGLDRVNGVDRLRLAFITDGPRALLWSSADDTVAMLCESEQGVFRLSYTDEIELRFERHLDQPPTMSLQWGEQTYRARRAPQQ